jgi:hypothetical protein
MLEDKRSEAERARDALRYHGAQLQDRLKPASLLDDAKGLAQKRALALAGTLLASKKGRPALAVGAVAAGAAYLLRKPLAKLFADRMGRKG